MKYEYGKEYVCNGERPEGLADDVVMVSGYLGRSMDNLSVGRACVMDWSDVSKFRIVDERYKPDQGDWHKRGGFPPVGEVCELLLVGNEWDKCMIIAADGDARWVKFLRSTYTTISDPSRFRPLRTEEDKLLAAAEALIEQKTGEPANSTQIKVLIDDGWRPTEGEK